MDGFYCYYRLAEDLFITILFLSPSEKFHHTDTWPQLPHPEYEQTDPTNLSGINRLALVSPMPAHHSPATEFEQLCYTKNFIDAIRKSPYEALRSTESNLHGSILLASLQRSPVRFPPYQTPYGEREALEPTYPETAPHSPQTSPQQPSQSTTSSPSPGGALAPNGSSYTSPGNTSSTNNGRSQNSHTNNNSGGRGVTVPIMSYCIQDNGFKCSRCYQTFTHPSNFHRHYITVHTNRRNHKCSVCGKEFKRKDNMMSHMRSVHRPGRESHTVYRESTAVPKAIAACDMAQ